MKDPIEMQPCPDCVHQILEHGGYGCEWEDVGAEDGEVFIEHCDCDSSLLGLTVKAQAAEISGLESDLREAVNDLPTEGDHHDECGTYDGFVCDCVTALVAKRADAIRERRPQLFGEES